MGSVPVASPPATITPKAIRPGTARDLPETAELCVLFAREAASFQFDADYWTFAWREILRTGAGEILLAWADGALIGAIGLLYAPCLFDGQLYAEEAFWFVSPKHRGQGMRLLVAAENAARKRGAKRLVMAHLAGLNDRLAQIYERRGYHPLETKYALDLWHSQPPR